MVWLSRWMSHISETEFEQAARSLMQAALPEIARRLGPILAKMGLSETRGYVRARARSPVLRHARLSLQRDDRWQETELQRVIARAIDLAVEHISRQQMRPAVQPIRTRRAA